MDYLPTLGEQLPHSKGNVGKYSHNIPYMEHLGMCELPIHISRGLADIGVPLTHSLTHTSGIHWVWLEDGLDVYGLVERFDPVVWIPGIPENERDCYLGVPRFESQTTNRPNQQLTISW